MRDGIVMFTHSSAVFPRDKGHARTYDQKSKNVEMLNYADIEHHAQG